MEHLTCLMQFAFTLAPVEITENLLLQKLLGNESQSPLPMQKQVGY